MMMSMNYKKHQYGSWYIVGIHSMASPVININNNESSTLSYGKCEFADIFGQSHN